MPLHIISEWFLLSSEATIAQQGGEIAISFRLRLFVRYMLIITNDESVLDME